MPDSKNLILAVVVSLAIIVGFEFLWPKPAQQGGVETQTTATSSAPAPSSQAPGSQGTGEQTSTIPAPVASSDTLLPQPTVGGAAPVVPVLGQQNREALVAAPDRVRIRTSALEGSITPQATRIDDLTLLNYREETDPSSPNIVLFEPQGSDRSYYAEFGWVAGNTGLSVPGPNTRWETTSTVLTPQSPAVFTWDNGQGLLFRRTIAVDDNYMFAIHDTVENTTQEAVVLYPYGVVARGYTPDTMGFFILHEGPVGVFNGTLNEQSYKDLREKREIREVSTGGWIGFADKYWLSALIFDRDTETTTRYVHRMQDGRDRYQIDFLGTARAIPPGQSLTLEHDFFAGAKEVRLLDSYAEEYAIDRFDLAIDFGWFYFLTKPFFYFLLWLHGHLGNLGVAILAFTIILKALLFPLANKAYKSMSKLKQLQPEMQKIQERFKDDRQRMNQEVMAMYKKEGANPLSGCLPILIQIPIFFALYKVLFVSIEMRHAPFFGWIQDLSAPDPTSLFNLFGLLPFTPPSILMIGVWPLIMGFTMWLQQRLNPAPTDPIQAKILMFLPVIFTVMLASFPAGLVVYWAWNNTLSIAQQWIIMRRMGVKI